jgi:uncharacterized protein (TIGR02246 family)
MATAQDMEARIRKLEARVQELEDERAIRELLARYGYNADACRDDAYVALFTEDGVMNLTTAGYGPDVKRWEGRKALKEFITDPTGHHLPGFYGNAMHMQGNNVVSYIKGETAVVNSYSVVLQADGGEVKLFSAGNNEWLLEKVDGNWLFKERCRRQIGGAEYTSNLKATPR